MECHVGKENAAITNKINNEFDYELFKRYLQSIAGGNRSQETATAISHDVQLFFDSTSHCSFMSAVDILLNRKNLVQCIERGQTI